MEEREHGGKRPTHENQAKFFPRPVGCAIKIAKVSSDTLLWQWLLTGACCMLFDVVRRRLSKGTLGLDQMRSMKQQFSSSGFCFEALLFHVSNIQEYGYGSKLNYQGTAGFSPCFCLPGFHFGNLILSHSHNMFSCSMSMYVCTTMCLHVRARA